MRDRRPQGRAPFAQGDDSAQFACVAPLQDRIAVWSQRVGIPLKEAAHQVRTADRERTDFIRDHFRKDPREPQNYHLVLNTSCFSIDQNTDVIVAALHSLQDRSADGSTGLPSK